MRSPAALLLAAVLSAGSALAQDECPIAGDYTGDPATYESIAAQHLVVRVQSSFMKSGEQLATAEGVGFIVASQPHQKVVRSASGEVLRLSEPCLSQEIVIFTALHNVYNDNVDPPLWAERVVVELLSDRGSFNARIIRTAAVNQDMVLLTASVPSSYVWTGFRPAKSVEQDEILRIGDFQNGRVQFLQTRYLGVETTIDSKLRVSENVSEGNSGGPLFDKDWRIVGMITNADKRRAGAGLAAPSEVLELFLASYGYTPNLPPAEAFRRTQERQKRDRKFRGVEFWTLFGIGRLDSVDLPPGLGRFAIVGGVPIYRLGPIGFKSVFAWSSTAGYQDEAVFGETGLEMGLGTFLLAERLVSASVRWSPSILLTRNNEFDFAVALPAYAAQVEVGWERVHVGVDVRGVSPPGDRDDFTQFVAYGTWRHE